MENLSIRAARGEDVRLLEAFAVSLGRHPDSDYFIRQLERQAEGERVVFIAEIGAETAGFAILNWAPKYALFKRLGFPEIQDLNVHSRWRRQGIATRVIAHCEDMARARGCGHMGIAVGLDASYGAAQRLYVRLGYVPDGFGVTYDREPVGKGEMRPVDDELSLMLVKEL